MIIGIVADPLSHPDWQGMKAFLEPAARLGGHPVLETNEAVWAVYEDGLTAAATARLTTEGIGEIVLCGGREAHRWATALADRICDWFRDEGMKTARIYGRKGWGRLLGWEVIGATGRTVLFERAL